MLFLIIWDDRNLWLTNHSKRNVSQLFQWIFSHHPLNLIPFINKIYYFGSNILFLAGSTYQSSRIHIIRLLSRYIWWKTSKSHDDFKLNRNFFDHQCHSEYRQRFLSVYDKCISSSVFIQWEIHKNKFHQVSIRQFNLFESITKDLRTTNHNSKSIILINILKINLIWKLKKHHSNSIVIK